MFFFFWGIPNKKSGCWTPYFFLKRFGWLLVILFPELLRRLRTRFTQEIFINLHFCWALHPLQSHVFGVKGHSFLAEESDFISIPVSQKERVVDLAINAFFDATWEEHPVKQQLFWWMVHYFLLRFSVEITVGSWYPEFSAKLQVSYWVACIYRSVTPLHHQNFIG